ncbi:PQQ-dependent sugar dehydrogenase [Amaricoccus solimangrovi]|uniref:PQQ-dependent sugar dehydrogenase n=1 Tax=Amaricoccus solimangrovi TaxID=2589815 RepID=UPI001AED3841|nr:sorbosone dehydrogenase family protein [Amaricoccus solimangrovi]
MFAATLLAACADARATVPIARGYGPDPVLPPPRESVLPSVHIARADPWPEGGGPTAAPGLAVRAFAAGLDHPRWLHVLPNGDVLVAETDAPARHDETGFDPKAWVMKAVMGRAGAGRPSANRITLLRDRDGDGVAELRSTLLEGLNSPFGMTLSRGRLYVADTDALLAFPYWTGDTRITAPGVRIADLPAGPINHHWTKDVIASPDGRGLYVTVGSNSNAGENGLEAEAGRAGILEIDLATGSIRQFASGLRNPNGLAWQPDSGALWVAVNERDELGSDLVPDYMTHVRDGGFYGWPWSYYGAHPDPRVEPARPDLAAKAIVPDYALGPHTASLGLAFAKGGALGPAYRDGAFVGQHGSWNRLPRSGYKVIFVPFANGAPAGPPRDVLTGFLGAEDTAHGRPVGVAIDRQGALLVADDVGGRVWRVTRATGEEERP